MMALQGDKDEIQEVPIKTTQTQTKNANCYHIVQVAIDKPANAPEALTLRCTWQRGYDDDGTFVGVEQRDCLLLASELAPYLSALVTTGNTIEQDLKQKLWDCLKGLGHVPEGSVM